VKYVGGAGPYGPLWIIGEGPGKTEEAQGEPFVGKTGGDLRRIVTRAGMAWQDVRRDNAIPYRVTIPKDGASRGRLIDQHRQHLDGPLREAASLGRLPRVIVACGAVATQRLIGVTSIMEAWGGTYTYNYCGVDIVVVPTIHPAAVMRTKLQAEKLLVDRAVTRAVRLALGHEACVAIDPEVVVDPTPRDLHQVLAQASDIVVDTEFNPAKRETWVLGIEADNDARVWSVCPMTMTGAMRAVLKHHFRRTDLVKTAHYHFADVEALGWAGIDTSWPWFDTLVAFATLYPDLPVGLSHVARFYLTGIVDWKGMDKLDRQYNAIDVRVTQLVRDAIRQEMTEAQMWPVWEEEVQWALPLLYGLQTRGLQVDRRSLRRARVLLRRERSKLLRSITREVSSIFARRTQAQMTVVEGVEDAIKGVLDDWDTRRGVCEVHPTYDGTKLKKFSTKQQQCKCQVIASEAGDVRNVIAGLQKQRTAAKGKAKKWDRGFDPANNDHVRWLLYDKQGLALPVQRHPETKQPTANATAVAKLLVLKTVQAKAGVPVLLEMIKRLQHLDKLANTFYDIPMDRNGIVYPPYRMHGAGTGRPAGGEDEFLGEKGVSQYRFNVLNIPKEVRQVYVPFARGA